MSHGGNLKSATTTKWTINGKKKTKTLAYQIQGSIHGGERDIRNEFEMVSKA